MSKRGKQKNKVDFRIKDVYKFYKSINPKGSDFYVDYKRFSEITHAGMQKISDLLLNESEIIKLPYGLGELSIIKRKNSMRKMYIDFKTTREVGETVYFFNDHTRGYIFRFRWRKNIVFVKNRKHYSFIPSRGNKRQLAALIKSGKVDYWQV